MQSTLNRWHESLATIEESWNDETAKNFHSQSLGEIEGVYKRMMVSLNDATEFVGKMEKLVRDPDKFES